MDTNCISEKQFEIETKKQNINWLPLTENESYLVSDNTMKVAGRPIDVVCLQRERSRYRVVSLFRERRGEKYLAFRVYGVTNGKGHFRLSFHRARLKAFKGNPSVDMVCRHLDGDSSNNSLSNLEWGTRRENMADLSRNGTLKGEKNPSAKINAEVALTIYILSNLSLVDAFILNELEIGKPQVSAIEKRRSWAHVTTDEVSAILVLAKDAFNRKMSDKVNDALRILKKEHARDVRNLKNSVKEALNK